MPRYVPDRGDAVRLSFSPQTGHERAGRRPALVASPVSYNRKVGLALVWPIASQRKGYPFEVSLPADSEVAGVVLADQLKGLDWRVRRAKFICRVPRLAADTGQRVDSLPAGGVEGWMRRAFARTGWMIALPAAAGARA